MVSVRFCEIYFILQVLLYTFNTTGSKCLFLAKLVVIINNCIFIGACQQNSMVFVCVCACVCVCVCVCVWGGLILKLKDLPVCKSTKVGSHLPTDGAIRQLAGIIFPQNEFAKYKYPAHLQIACYFSSIFYYSGHIGRLFKAGFL